MRGWSLLFAVQLACASPRHGDQLVQATGGVGVLPVGEGPAARAECERPSEALVRKERRQALEAFVAGRHRDAVATLERAARERPEDLATHALLEASRTRQLSAAARTAPAFDTLPRMKLFPPGEGYKLVKPIAGLGPPEQLKLSRVAETPNRITDDEAWFQKHKVTVDERSELRVSEQDLPDAAPRVVLGARAQRMFAHPDHTLVSYGSTLALMWPPARAQLFDVSGFSEIWDARVVNRSLVLATWRNGYARDVGGKTGYLVAYSTEDGSLLWQSEPLVTAMGGFVVTSRHIVSGYGFTAEPDHVFLLDLATGQRVQRETLRSGPSVIVQRGDRILLRSYDSDAEFRLSPAPGPAPGAGLPQAGAPSVDTTSARTLCQAERALVAIDRRDDKALKTAIAALSAEQADDEVVASFEAVWRFLQQQKSQAPAIDLWTKPPQKLATPPWQRERRKSVGEPVTGRPLVRQLSSGPASPVRNMAPLGGAPFVPGRPSFLAPVLKGKLPAGARSDIPSSYGLEHLYAIIPDQEERLLLIYGGRYLVVVRGSTTEAVFDFESWRHPPNVDPAQAQFAIADVTYALVRGGTLFVAHGGGSYAKEMGGKKGFVSALDLKSGELSWRSDPVVNGGAPFVFWRDFLVTAYGFTAEPDNVYLLRRDTGETVTKATLKSAPDDLVLQGDRLRVEAYDHVHEFELSLR